MSLREKMKPKSKEEIIGILKQKGIPEPLLKKVKKSPELFDRGANSLGNIPGEKPLLVIFKKIPKLPDIINSEGGIFEIVEGISFSISSKKFITRKNLFNKGITRGGKCRVYAKFNHQSLELYFQGRITLIELFLLRMDEPYVVETRRRNEKGSTGYKQDFVFYDDDFEWLLLSKIQCGSDYYFQLPEGMRIDNPGEDVLDFLKTRL